MSFMRLPPRFPSRLPSLRPRTGDEGERRGSEHACHLLCWLLPPSNLSDQRACFLFPPLPPSSLFLSDSFSLRRLRPLCSPWPHHSLRHSRVASWCAYPQDQFRLPTLVVIARPTSRYPPIDTLSLFSGHPPRSHGLISTGAGIFTDDIPPFIPARSIAGAVPSQHVR